MIDPRPVSSISPGADRNPEREFERRRMWALAGELANDTDVQALIEFTRRDIEARGPRRRLIRYGSWALVAASCAAIACGLWLALLRTPQQVYITAIGEQRSVVLADGSSVVMNTDTRLRVAFERTRRRIELDAGEATFSVQPDAQRPFEVITAAGTTRAIGTEFNLRNLGGRVEVAVLEGRINVDVATEHGAVPVKVELAGGQATRYGAGEPAGIVYPANLSRITAWREQRIEFQDVSLAEAIEEYNRYTTGRLSLADPARNMILVTGRFRIDEPEAFVNALQRAYGFQVTRSGNDVILSAAPSE